MLTSTENKFQDQSGEREIVIVPNTSSNDNKVLNFARAYHRDTKFRIYNLEDKKYKSWKLVLYSKIWTIVASLENSARELLNWIFFFYLSNFLNSCSSNEIRKLKRLFLNTTLSLQNKSKTWWDASYSTFFFK